MLVYAQLFVHQDHKVTSPCSVAFQTVLRMYGCMGFVLCQDKAFVGPSAELHDVLVCSVLQPVQVPLNAGNAV